MSKIAKKLTELIGNTPLLELSKIEKLNKIDAQILGKLEYLNPARSVKDRFFGFFAGIDNFQQFQIGVLPDALRQFKIERVIYQRLGKRLLGSGKHIEYLVGFNDFSATHDCYAIAKKTEKK
ncbi:hypothetical protein FACS18947_7270 [Bacteroidia bacterium]|nr:hypothetical protein FACS18947_7270 [Bacteroidia bacterium]